MMKVMAEPAVSKWPPEITAAGAVVTQVPRPLSPTGVVAARLALNIADHLPAPHTENPFRGRCEKRNEVNDAPLSILLFDNHLIFE